MPEHRRRPYRVQVRLDEEEYDYFIYNVTKTGLSIEAYLRQIIGDRVPRLKEERKQDKDIVSQLYAIGNNLNQIARKAHSLHSLDVDRYEKAVHSFQTIMKAYLDSR